MEEEGKEREGKGGRRRGREREEEGRTSVAPQPPKAGDATGPNH